MRGDRLGLGAGAGRAQQGEAAVGFGPLRPRGAEADREVEEQRAEGVAGVRLGQALLRHVKLAQPRQQPPPRRQRRASLLIRERHRHLGPRGEPGDQRELVLGQVVEAVEEDRPRAPE